MVDLVGRAGEVGRLAGLVAGVVRGRGESVWVEGEPGIGKSALLAAGLAAASASQGCQVFWGVAEELGQRFPLRAVLDCLAVRADSPDRARSEIAALLRGESGGEDLGDEDGVSRVRVDPVPAVSERLLALVDLLCAAAPVVLVLDDVQWADEASLAVWHRLVRSVSQLPLLVVAACRPLPRRAELAALRRAVAGGGVLIELAPLPPKPVLELVGGLVGATAIGPGLARAVAQAAGNPLYVREVVDALGREGRLTRAGGTAELAGSEANSGVSVSLAAAITDRLGFLSTDTLGMCRAAALLGAEFSAADLVVVAGQPLIDLAARIEEAVAAGVLVESGTRLAFRHVLIRQALYEGTPTAVRLALHAQAAHALATSGASAEHVAEQLLAADTPQAAAPLPGWVADWLLHADRLLSYRAPQVAADLLHRTVASLPAADDRREPLQVDLASVLLLLGRHEEVVAVAAPVLAATGDPSRRAALAWTLGLALNRLDRHDEALEVLGRALAAPAPPGERRGLSWPARILALRAMVHAMTRRSQEEIETEAEQALAAAERAADPVAVGTASNVLGVLLTSLGNWAGALPVLERGLAAIGQDLETADLRLLLLHNRQFTLANLDRLAEAEQAVAETVEAAERTGSPARLAAVRIGAAQVYYDLGRWDDALAQLEMAADPPHPVAAVRIFLYGVWALIAGHRDDLPAAEAQLSALADTPIPPGVVLGLREYLAMARAVLDERRGRLDQALGHLQGLIEQPDTEVFTEQHQWLPDLVRLALTLNDTSAARAAAKTAAARTPTASQGAAVQRCRGLLDADPALLRGAAEAYRRVGRPLQLAQTLEDMAVLLARSEDRAAARGAYLEATEIYSRLGAGWDLRRADARLRPFGIRSRRSPSRRDAPTSGWAALSPAETRIARLVADGRSNPDIAAELLVSRSTIETHVSRILAKLGARSRVDIARQAAAQPAIASSA